MRYFPQTEQDRAAMLQAIGVGSVDELFEPIPEYCRFTGELNVGAPLHEMEACAHMHTLADNKAVALPSFTGGGFYDHFIPAVVDALSMRSEFYTAYTPYQPEASQGHLQIFFEYQTMICELTGMDVSNASMYDGASALAEGALMACRVKRRSKVAVPANLNPEYLETLKTYLRWADLELAMYGVGADGLVDSDRMAAAAEDAAAVILQNPNFFGLIEDGAAAAAIAHAAGAALLVSADPISLACLKRPGDYGADIVTGEGQPLGSPVYFGGQGFGIMASTDEFIRKMPGRIIGRTVDSNGDQCCVLTLQTREQHIRRSRATSNICSNQAWCVTRSVIYMSAMGPQGLQAAARNSAAAAHLLAEQSAALDGFELVYGDAPYFREFVLCCSEKAAAVNRKLLNAGFVGGVDLGRYYPERENELLLAATEKRTAEQIAGFVKALGACR